jgi:hypothetical protein
MAQEAATKELLAAASDGKEALVKKCIADDAELDAYKDEARGPTFV